MKNTVCEVIIKIFPIIVILLNSIACSNNLTVSKGERYHPRLPGYKHLPKPFAKQVVIDGEYEGGFKIMFNYSEHGVKKSDEKFLRILCGEDDITKGVDRVNKVIIGYVARPVNKHSLSFAVVTSKLKTKDMISEDIWPPMTEIKFKGVNYLDSEDNVHISTKTLISLVAEDDRKFVRGTYYELDLTEELFYKGFTPDTLTQFIRYDSPFKIHEGKYWIGYGSIDKADNYELLKSATFYVDGTLPESEISIAGKTLKNEVTSYITPEDDITVKSQDPLNNGVVSGIKKIEVCVVADAQKYISSGVNGGYQKNCKYVTYVAPFKLKKGDYIIYYRAVDMSGNLEAWNYNYFVVK